MSLKQQQLLGRVNPAGSNSLACGLVAAFGGQLEQHSQRVVASVHGMCLCVLPPGGCLVGACCSGNAHEAVLCCDVQGHQAVQQGKHSHLLCEHNALELIKLEM